MTIHPGAHGPNVKEVQARLNGLGYGPGVVDGIYGPASMSAVRIFQGASGLEVDAIVGPLTMEALSLPHRPDASQEPAILKAVRRKGYEVYEDRVNLVGVRAVPGIQNRFDDEFHIAWFENDHWQHKVYACTTDPGTYWLENPLRVEGAAVLEPGQYRDVYTFDLHQGRNETLCQRGGVVVVRRGASTLDTGWHGINIHHAGEDSTAVNKWSAGCTVFRRKEDWKHAMAVCKASGDEVFTYTLLLSTDVT